MIKKLLLNKEDFLELIKDCKSKDYVSYGPYIGTDTEPKTYPCIAMIDYETVGSEYDAEYRHCKIDFVYQTDFK